jgi:hypothetical protein
VQGDGVREAVGDEGPRETLVAEIARQLHHERAPLPAAQEVRRLPLIGPAGLDAVARPDRDIEFLFGVAIEVADERIGAAVLAVEPAFVGAGQTRPALTNRLRQRQRARSLSDALLTGSHQRRARHHAGRGHTPRRNSNCPHFLPL